MKDMDKYLYANTYAQKILNLDSGTGRLPQENEWINSFKKDFKEAVGCQTYTLKNRSILFCIVCIFIILLPVPEKIMIADIQNRNTMLWPKMKLKPENPKPGETIKLIISDSIPWINVIITLDGVTYESFNWPSHNDVLYTWKWRFLLPEGEEHEIVFYHDADTGAIERARTVIGGKTRKEATAVASETTTHFLPTKLGVFMANPGRNWHGKNGWNVELTYVKKTTDKYWCVRDLAYRVSQSVQKGLRVLVRVDYDTGQSIPQKNDKLALSEYLSFVKRLARDHRLKDVYAYIIGSGYNKCTIEDKQKKSKYYPCLVCPCTHGIWRKTITYR